MTDNTLVTSYKMKISILCLFFWNSFLFSQKQEQPLFYAGLGYYRHTSFDANSYYHGRIGSQIFSYKFISPEIDFTYYFGGNERVAERFADTGFPVSVIYKNFRAGIWGLAPKIFFGDNILRWVIIPKYHFGKVAAESLVSTNGGATPISERDEFDSNISFWSFSIGGEGILINENFKIGIYLVYTGFDAGRAMNRIPFQNSGERNSDIETSTLGLSVRLLYLPWKMR